MKTVSKDLEKALNDKFIELDDTFNAIFLKLKEEAKGQILFFINKSESLEEIKSSNFWFNTFFSEKLTKEDKRFIKVNFKLFKKRFEEEKLLLKEIKNDDNNFTLHMLTK
ncbi:MAG: hypothetical protein WCO35_00545 [Candidatus Nomurabacteria bacterium]